MLTLRSGGVSPPSECAVTLKGKSPHTAALPDVCAQRTPRTWCSDEGEPGGGGVGGCSRLPRGVPGDPRKL